MIGEFVIQRFLFLSVSLLLLFFGVPSVGAAAAVNAFSLELIRLWTPDTLMPSQPACKLAANTETTKRMGNWLEQASDRDAHAAFHRGVLACLQGNEKKALEAWLEDNNHPASVLFAAIAAFAQGHRLETPFADQVGNYGYNMGGIREREGNIFSAISWYSFSLAYRADVKAADKLANLYHVRGEDGLAEETWRRVAEALPTSAPGHWEALAQTAELKQEWSTAADAYAQGAAIADTTAAYSLWLQSGYAWLRAKVHSSAEEAFRQALTLNPDKVDAYLRMGEVFRYQKRYEEAAIWYQRARGVAPNHYAPPYYLGLLERAQGNYEAALIYFEQSLALKPDNVDVLYYKALMLDALQHRGDAITVLNQAIATHKNPPQSWLDLQKRWQRYPIYAEDPDRWWEKGQVAEKEKDWARTAAIYEAGAARAFPPDDYRLLNRAALMYRYLEAWEQATAIYEDLIGRYPDRLDAYLGLGEVFRLQGKYDTAAVLFRQAQAVDSDHYAPPYYLGLVSYAQKHYGEALDYFETSLTLKPENPGALYYKAQALKALDHPREAIEILTEAIAHHSNPPESWQELLEKWETEE